MANATGTNASQEFDHVKATYLLFPERSITDGFTSHFLEDEILVMIRNKYDLHNLLKYYQESFFREKIADAKWLSSATPAIAGMCTDGCAPFIDYNSREDWDPPEHDTVVPLGWLGQKIKLRYSGKIGNDCYFGARIYDSRRDDLEEKHDLGTKILLGLVFNDSDFSFYHLRHVFGKLGYETRLSIRTKDTATCLQRLKEKIQLLAAEIFNIFGETIIPELLPYKDERRKGLVTAIDQINKRTGSINAAVYLNSFTSGEGEHKSLEADVGFKVEHNMFARENVALSQLRGVEAMNLFLVRCKQLKREEESQ